MKGESLDIRKLLFLSQGIDAIDLRQTFDDFPAFLWKVLHEVDKASSGVAKAVTEDGLELLGEVPGEGVAHVDRRVQPGGPALEDLIQVLSGVLAAGEKQGYLVWSDARDNPRGKDALAGIIWGDCLAKAVHPHGGIVGMDQAPVGRMIHELLINQFGNGRSGRDQLPLRGGRQRHSQNGFATCRSDTWAGPSRSG